MVVTVDIAAKKLSKKRKTSKTREPISSPRARVRAGAPTTRNYVSINFTPTSSTQEPSEPISPVNTTEGEVQHRDRFFESDFIDAQSNSASGRSRGDLTHPLQELSLSQYEPGSIADNDGQRVQGKAQAASQDVYMETETAIEALNLESIPIRPSFGYTTPEYPRISDGTRMSQSSLALQQPAMLYDSFSPPVVSQNCWNQSQWNHSSFPTIIQSPFQLSVTVNGDAHMPGFQPQQLSHVPPPNREASQNIPQPIETYDPTSSFRATSFNQGIHGLSPCGYQMGGNHFDLRQSCRPELR